VQTFQNFVSPSYLETINIPLLLGRRFSERDDEQSPRVAIINQTLARRLWPNENPLGKRLTWKVGPDAQQSAEVIGVARDQRRPADRHPARVSEVITTAMATYL